MGGDRIPGPFNDAVDEETRRRREQDKRHHVEARDIAGLLERAQESYIHEFGRLHNIAVDVFHGSRGGFLKRYADAFAHADVWNKRLMRPVWETLIRKYGLEEDPAGTGGSPPAEPREDP